MHLCLLSVPISSSQIQGTNSLINYDVVTHQWDDAVHIRILVNTVLFKRRIAFEITSWHSPENILCSRCTFHWIKLYSWYRPECSKLGTESSYDVFLLFLHKIYTNQFSFHFYTWPAIHPSFCLLRQVIHTSCTLVRLFSLLCYWRNQSSSFMEIY